MLLLLRVVFHAKNGGSADVMTNFRKAFKDADDFFDVEGNDREIEVLSAATLATLIEGDTSLAAWSALAITTSSVAGARPLDLPMNLVDMAERAVARLADSFRQRPDLKDLAFQTPKLSFTLAKEKLTSIDAAGIGAALDAAAEAVSQKVNALSGKVKSYADATADYIAIQDEELEMLWWVLGERSDGREMPFAELSENEHPLVFGSELASATVYLPGPRSIDGILGRAGLTASQELTIAEAVNACKREWLKDFVEAEAKSFLTRPIHFAIQRMLETSDETSWIPGWSAGSGIDSALTFSALTIAKLFYRERLLITF